MIIIYICVFVVCIIYCDSTGALLLSQDVSFAHSSQI